MHLVHLLGLIGGNIILSVLRAISDPRGYLFGRAPSGGPPLAREIVVELHAAVATTSRGVWRNIGWTTRV